LAAMPFDKTIQRLNDYFAAPVQGQSNLAFVTEFGIAFAIGLVVGIGLARYRAHLFQNRGEAALAKAIKTRFRPPHYFLLNHLTVPTNEGTTQIDHILVSRHGVCVIETKDYSGWIFGGAEQRQWTQVIYRVRHRFQNPIHQNRRHVQAVRAILDFLPSDAVSSAVVFTGDAEFKTAKPVGVFDIEEFLNYVSGQVQEVMSQNRIQFCVGRLETTRAEVTKQIDIEHVAYVRQRHARDD
jgi:hypothetical protein